MRHDYEMTQEHPCPLCQGVHQFTGTDGVPVWDPKVGVVFHVTCPSTGGRVEVVVPPIESDVPNDPPAATSATDVPCPVCKKANFKVVREDGVGPTVVQWLECSNAGCAYETMRRFNKTMGITINT